jgi:hypothetical protein
MMDNFLVEIVYVDANGAYMACYADGQNVLLGADTYHDAVLEADLLSPSEYA